MANKLIEEMIEIYESLYHPVSEQIKEYKIILKFPALATNYCALDKLLAPRSHSNQLCQIPEKKADSEVGEKKKIQLVPLSNKSGRRCAFCLKSIPVGEIKKCGKCHRRAYCGHECAAADWSCAPNQTDVAGEL